MYSVYFSSHEFLWENQNKVLIMVRRCKSVEYLPMCNWIPRAIFGEKKDYFFKIRWPVNLRTPFHTSPIHQHHKHDQCEQRTLAKSSSKSPCVWCWLSKNIDRHHKPKSRLWNIIPFYLLNVSLNPRKITTLGYFLIFEKILEFYFYR